MIAERIQETVYSWFAKDFRELGHLLKDKKVALVGNASNAPEGEIKIDNNDVVVRINRGYLPTETYNNSVKRTDILLVSKVFSEAMNSKIEFIVQMSPLRRKEMNLVQIRRSYLYPSAWWSQLHAELGSRPSTGCMGIDLVCRLIGSGQLRLYGFDFWRSPTSYTGISRPGPHDPVAEEAFARRRVPSAF